MLDGYFDFDNLTGKDFGDARKRLLAVKAALEIAKHAVDGSAGAATYSLVDQHLESVTTHIEALADAIQATLDK